MSKINYQGTTLEQLYNLALIGADFCTEKNNCGVSVTNTLKKQLYVKTVLLSRLLNVIDIPEDRVMSIEQYNKNKVSLSNIEGNGKTKLKSDFKIFKDMLNDEIANTNAVNNDVATRLDDIVKEDLKPENLEVLKSRGEELLTTINSIANTVSQ